MDVAMIIIMMVMVVVVVVVEIVCLSVTNADCVEIIYVFYNYVSTYRYWAWMDGRINIINISIKMDEQTSLCVLLTR